MEEISYLSPDISGMKVPNPKNGGTEIQSVYIQIEIIILKLFNVCMNY